jgi:23S rRNA pseudouridine1911/1915/1917 synthase
MTVAQPRKLQVPRDAPARLDLFLRRALPAYAPADLNSMVERGLIRVDGKKAKVMRRLFGGETVELHFEAPKKLAAVEGPALEVLFEDGDLVLINKQAGLTVEHERLQPLPSVSELAASQLSGFDVGGLAVPGIVHRLDKETTGCLLLAKTDAALSELKQAFEDKRIAKIYLALVVGTPPPEGTLDTPYTKDPQNPRRYTTKVESPRRARLSFKTLETFEDAEVSLLEIALDTGRTHQIRAQFAELGHPLLSDPTYGGPMSPVISRISLHASQLRVERASGTLEVSARLPLDLRTALDVLRGTGRV